MQTKYCTLECCENLIQKYYNAGGEMATIDDGCLGLGLRILYNCGNENLREFVIEEYYINAWSSGHKVKIYTQGLPKKYLKMIEDYENGLYDDYE